MKRKSIAIAVAAATVATAMAQTPAPEAPVYDEAVQEAVATLVVSNFQAGMSTMFAELEGMGLSVDSARVAQAVLSRLGNPYSQEAHQAAAATLAHAVDRIAVERENSYMTAAAATPGAQRLPSGVVMLTERAGTGANPTATDTISFNYRGTLPDGTVFDQSYGREPLVGQASQMVPGLTEAILTMQPGGKYTVWIPSEKAYGPRGFAGVIPPNSPLKFEIELLEIQ